MEWSLLARNRAKPGIDEEQDTEKTVVKPVFNERKHLIEICPMLLQRRNTAHRTPWKPRRIDVSESIGPAPLTDS